MFGVSSRNKRPQYNLAESSETGNAKKKKWDVATMLTACPTANVVLHEFVSQNQM
jgi:hypothetical protein